MLKETTGAFDGTRLTALTSQTPNPILEVEVVRHIWTGQNDLFSSSRFI